MKNLRSKNWIPTTLALFSTLVLASGCDQTTGVFDITAVNNSTRQGQANFSGCSSAEASTFGVINIKLSIPSSASKIYILRDSSVIATLDGGSTTLYSDTTVVAGQTYTYQCNANIYGSVLPGQHPITIAAYQLSDFPGLSSAVGVGIGRIALTFAVPKGASAFNIYRDQILLTTITSTSATTYTDSNSLQEGFTYSYSCNAILGGVTKACKSTLTASTKVQDAPTFAGIITQAAATSITSNSASISWNEPPVSSVPPVSYMVYGNLGTSVNWGGTPLATLLVSQNVGTTYTATSLGDQLTYSFGVRACSTSTICDTNTAQVTVTLPDGGPPKTSGISSVSISSGIISINAPWQPSMGAVSKRKIYEKVNGVLVSNTPVQTVIVTDLTNPLALIPLNINVNDHTTYSFNVVDYDSSNNSNANTTWASITTGVTHPPIFAGITGVALGSPTDSAVILQWNLINNATDTTNGLIGAGALATNPYGAASYNIYMASLPGSSLPGGTDACTNGTLINTINAPSTLSNANPYSFTVSTGLTQRTTYMFCVKAVDAYGNISINAPDSAPITTHDITAPLFDGIQSIGFSSGATPTVNLTWNTSPSPDILQYRVTIWSQLGGVNASTATTAATYTYLLKTNSGYPTGASFAQTDFSYPENSTVYAIVDACDNAAGVYGTQNCTSFPISTAQAIFVPRTTPPQGFGGPTSATATIEGQATVNWAAVTGWSDYTGFNVYNYDPTNTGSPLTLLGNCPCSVPSTTCPTSCTVTGLDVHRIYNLYVRPYDSYNNIFQTPYNQVQSITSAQTTHPTFVSNLTAALAAQNNGVTLTWNTATDPQYTGTYGNPGNAIQYLIYRKLGTSFASATAPAGDGTLISTVTTLATYTDPKLNLTQNVTNYYTVCARDNAMLVTCDGVVKSVAIPDIVPPVIGTPSLATDFSLTTPTAPFHITWGMSDNISTRANLTVQLYRKYGSSPTDYPQATDSGLVTVLTGKLSSGLFTTDGLPSPKYTFTEAPGNTYPLASYRGWLNYTMVVVDEAGNLSTSANLSFWLDNIAIVCPPGFVGVPGNPTFNTVDFCVSKYLPTIQGYGTWTSNWTQYNNFSQAGTHTSDYNCILTAPAGYLAYYNDSIPLHPYGAAGTAGTLGYSGSNWGEPFINPSTHQFNNLFKVSNLASAPGTNGVLSFIDSNWYGATTFYNWQLNYSLNVLAAGNANNCPLETSDASQLITDTDYDNICQPYQLSDPIQNVGSGGNFSLNSTPTAVAYGFPLSDGSGNNFNSTNYRGISNNEWLTIAYNALLVNGNWTSGTAATGQMPISSGPNMARLIEQSIAVHFTPPTSPDPVGAAWSNSLAYTASQPMNINGRRILQLQNGGVIWDMLGYLPTRVTGLNGTTGTTTLGDWNSTSAGIPTGAPYDGSTWVGGFDASTVGATPLAVRGGARLFDLYDANASTGPSLASSPQLPNWGWLWSLVDTNNSRHSATYRCVYRPGGPTAQ